MAKVVSITCDLTQAPDAETHLLKLDDRVLQIDLCQAEFDKLVKVLNKYFSAGTVTVKASNGGASELDAIRTWANANGHTVAPKGRIAADVVEAYNAAHAPAA